MVQGQYIGVIKVFQNNGNMPARFTGPTCTMHRFFLVCKAEFFSVFIVSCLQFLFSGSQNSLLMMTKGRVRQLPYDTEKNSIREVLNGQDLKQLVKTFVLIHIRLLALQSKQKKNSTETRNIYKSVIFHYQCREDSR